mgnify:CR=1 FL=1
MSAAREHRFEFRRAAAVGRERDRARQLESADRADRPPAADDGQPVRGKDALSSTEREELARLRRENRRVHLVAFMERDAPAVDIAGIGPAMRREPAQREARAHRMAAGFKAPIVERDGQVVDQCIVAGIVKIDDAGEAVIDEQNVIAKQIRVNHALWQRG